MANRPGCFIYIKQDPHSVFGVELRHYEELRRQLEDPSTATGWVELDSNFGDGKVFLRVEDITSLTLATEEYCAAIDADAITSDA